LLKIRLASLRFAPLGAATIDAIIQSEFEFTRDKIDTNFSNYSAFHYRSKLLPLILNSKSKSKSNSNSKLEIAREELQICQSAVFTEPGERAKRASLDEDEHTRDESTPAKWLQTFTT